MEALAALAPDLGVVAAYGRMLPDVLLALPRLGMINVHASLLPKYRGAAPIHRAVMAGESETGVTIIRLVREMDAGPMLRRAGVPIGPDDTSEALDRTLAELGAAVLMEAVDDLDRGHAVETAQDHALATFAPRLTREDGAIDWTRPARSVHDQVRGLHPWPRAVLPPRRGALSHTSNRRSRVGRSRHRRTCAPASAGTGAQGGRRTAFRRGRRKALRSPFSKFNRRAGGRCRCGRSWPVAGWRRERSSANHDRPGARRRAPRAPRRAYRAGRSGDGPGARNARAERSARPRPRRQDYRRRAALAGAARPFAGPGLVADARPGRPGHP